MLRIFGKISKLYQYFKMLTTRKGFFQRRSILVMVLTHIAHMILDWSVNNVKEGRNLFSYSLSHRTEEREVSHMICESLVNPKKSSRWSDVPILIGKIMFLMKIFSFRAPSLPFLYQQNLI